jgi:glycosyltransferase involved in cell wall biosynthesis
VAEITTVSRYMRHLMWRYGVNPLVISNGIPETALAEIDPTAVDSIRTSAHTPCLAVKVGRFCPDKRWHQAIDAVATLHRRGLAARLLMRGGIEPFANEVIAHCRRSGLDVADHGEPLRDAHDIGAALAATTAPVVNLLSFVDQAVALTMFAAADAVLANSGHEPFGLVGLEAMAAGGVAIVGDTGEEYARPYVNALSVRSDDGAEVASALLELNGTPELHTRLRQNARRDAADLTWTRVIDGLVARLGYICEHQGVRVPVPSA